MDTDSKHRRAGPAPRVLIGARVRSSTEPVADSSQRVRGQVRYHRSRCSNLLLNGPFCVTVRAVWAVRLRLRPRPKFWSGERVLHHSSPLGAQAD